MRVIEWRGTTLRFLDQTQLPLVEAYVETADYRVVAGAIRSLRLRGAPLIGVAAAYGTALAAISSGETSFPAFRAEIETAIDQLASTRPTAVNLFWALERMKKLLVSSGTVEAARTGLVQEAIRIHEEDAAMCRAIGEHGSTLVPQHASVLTHCNAGALATAGIGTALGILTTAHGQGKTLEVFADETRPLLQGARLTAWELLQAGINTTLITDSMAASLMQRHGIDFVVVGADRIASNGDVANKIGTYSLAILAHYHRIPFYVAAPSSTIDPSIKSGEEIPIEERGAEEITEGFGQRTAPKGIKVFAPAFDVTPASLVSAIITERGIHRQPYRFQRAVSGEHSHHP